MNRFFLALFLSLCCCKSPASANLEDELVSFFDKMGSSANVNSAEVYEGQKAGYATGGGFTVRNRSMIVQPATINFPKFDAGCGGIDLFTGGFSFIDSDQLIQALKSIGSSSVGYAFLLSLETVSPQIKNNIVEMQEWANKINNMNISSCESAASLVGSVWPAHSRASQHICNSIGNHHGLFRDPAYGRHQCAFESTREETTTKAQEENEHLLIENYNITWEAIRKHTLLSSEESIAEMLMTLMGTIIVKNKNIEPFPAKAVDDSFLQALLEGGQTTVYYCRDSNDKKCLNVGTRGLDIKRETSWSGRVEALLLSIKEKIIIDQELTEAERELLVKTSIPLYRYIAIIAAYKKGICPADIKQLSSLVATDLLIQYLHESLATIRTSCQMLKQNTGYCNQIDAYLDSLTTVERTIDHYETKRVDARQQELYIMQKMQLIEDQIAAEIFL